MQKITCVLALLAVAIVVSACGGGGGGGGGSIPTPIVTPAPPSSPGPSPTPTLTPTQVLVSPSVITASSLTSIPATLSASEASYTGGFSVVVPSACQGIISFYSTTSNANQFSYMLVGAGSCSFTVTDSRNNAVTIPVSVTTTTIVGS